MSEATRTITAPTPVRATTSLLLGLAVAIMAMPIATGIKLIGLLLSVAIALLVTFNHPYRREVRKAVEVRNEKYTTSFTQVLPLFPLWLALMVLPIMASSWVLAGIVFVIAAGYTWLVHPQLDGTAHIRPITQETGRPRKK